MFLAERASELFNDNLLTDRTIIDVIAFTKLAKSIPDYDKDFFENFAVRLLNEYDYIFYVSPKGVDIENNGVRETNAQYRDEIDQTIKKLLDKHQHRIKKIYTLSGSNEERIKKLLKAISL